MNMETPTKNYTLITGGTQGIGLELAKEFAANGHNLIIVARDEAQLSEASQQLQDSGVEVVTIAKDLFDANAAFELYEEVRGRALDVDILVNNAGQGVYGLFE